MTLSKKQKEELLKNPSVKSVTEKHVNFTFEFKVSAIKSYYKGLHPDAIFLKAGIDVSWFKPSYATYLLKNWRNRAEEKGMESLRPNSGRAQSGFKEIDLKYDMSSLEDLDRPELLELLAIQNKLLGKKKLSDPPNLDYVPDDEDSEEEKS